MECWIAVDGKNYSFNRAYSRPSKNEGWATLLSRLGQRDQRLGHPPVAVNCCVVPAAILAVAGLTVIEVNAVTVRTAVPLVVPELAVIVVVPAPTLVASP